MLINYGEYGALKADFHPSLGSFGQSHYRYLFGVMENGSLNQIDSIDILIVSNTTEKNREAWFKTITCPIS